jgi:two-component system, NtrC family, sensor kinase
MPSDTLPDAAHLTQAAEQMVQTQFDHLAEQVESLRKQLREAQRLAALGTMSAMIAHEFNNLMTPVISYAQYALDKADPALMKRATETALQHGKRASQMCDRILGMATQTHLGPGPVDLGPLVAETIAGLGRDLSKDNIQLRVSIPAGLRAKANAGPLQQVLFNLVLNARQAMLGKPGSLTVQAESLPNNAVALRVKDTGCGIKPEDMERIWEPFFTTRRHGDRPDQRGIGLGLTICKDIIEELDGSIGVESCAGQGTTFTIMLPGI